MAITILLEDRESHDPRLYQPRRGLVSIPTLGIRLPRIAWRSDLLGPATFEMTMHYHGTPITPITALYELAGRNFCVSHANPQDVARCHQIGQSVYAGLRGVL
jgi:hypothetical protein